MTDTLKIGSLAYDVHDHSRIGRICHTTPRFVYVRNEAMRYRIKREDVRRGRPRIGLQPKPKPEPPPEKLDAARKRRRRYNSELAYRLWQERLQSREAV